MSRAQFDGNVLTATAIALALIAGGCAHSSSNRNTEVPTQGAGTPVASVPDAGNGGQLQLDAAIDRHAYPEASLDDEEERDSELDDTPSEVSVKQHPLASYSDAELKVLFGKHPAFVGSVSIGKPNAGRLINGVQPKESPLYHLEDPAHSWGTIETVDALIHALEVVAQTHPGTSTVALGHLSALEGGPLRPHHSHQSGRDVDLGLYYTKPGTRWYTKATEHSLDAPRTWTLIRTLAKDTDIEMILLDRRLQEEVEQYAQSLERDSAWVHLLFHGGSGKLALVRHSPGHATHIHLRFRNPIAQETARRLSLSLPNEHRQQSSDAPVAKVHVATMGDTLAKLAQRYNTSMDAIRKANHMHTFQLVAGQRYVIPIEANTESHKR